MGIRRGSGPAGGPLLLVNAHLDTVFPEGTDVKVKRQGTRLMAPGIGDDTRGLALILALVRTLDAAKFTTPGDILFAGNVGEEGEGDLRGIKFLLKTGKYKDRIKQVLAIDGNESNGITRGGLGSRRYRVTFKGPGGHSYGAFGLVNPAFAMGGAIAKFARLEVPTKPKTTFNVGVVRGGTSVNSIPAEVSMDVDMRSEACSELNRLDQEFLAVVRQAVDEENRTRSTKEGRVEADPKIIGERPCGETRAGRADRPGGGRRDQGLRFDAGVLHQQHRRQHPDEPGHPGRDDRPRRTRRPGARARRMGRCRSRSQRQERSGGARDAPRRRRRRMIRSRRSFMEVSMKRWLATLVVFARLYGRRPRRCHHRPDDDGGRRNGGDGARRHSDADDDHAREGHAVAHRDGCRRAMSVITIADLTTKQIIVLRPDQKTATIAIAAPAPTTSRRRPRRRRRSPWTVPSTPTGKSQADRRDQMRRIHLHHHDGLERDHRRADAAGSRRDDAGREDDHGRVDVGGQGRTGSRRVRRLPEGIRLERHGCARRRAPPASTSRGWTRS